MDPIAILAILVGGVIAFSGYRLVVDFLRLWAFVIGAVIGGAVSTLFYPQGRVIEFTVPLLVFAAAGGVILALVGKVLREVVIFLTGALLGILIGTIGFSIISGGQQNLLVAFAMAAIVGLASVRFEDVVLMISTSFVGSAAAIYGVHLLTGLGEIFSMLAFFLLGLFGSAAQYKDKNP